ncbi:MAG: hypothetical protein U0167_18210 [bacterium]
MTVREGSSPLIAAALIGAAMVWLAHGPFDAPAAERVPLIEMRVVQPSGVVSAFPRRFAWRACPGAELYEITVANETERRTLFRQRGPVPGLDLTIAPGAEPPPGRYVWEVLALRHGLPLGRGVGNFVVRPDSAAH